MPNRTCASGHCGVSSIGHLFFIGEMISSNVSWSPKANCTMPSRQSIWIALTALGLLAATVAGYSWVRRQSLAGAWFLETKGERMPDALRIDRSKRELRVHFFRTPFDTLQETDTLELDSKEHEFPGSSGVFALTSGFGVVSTYSAKLEGKSLIVNEHYESRRPVDVVPMTEGVSSESWFLRDGGNRLVIVRGNRQITYKRSPLLWSPFGFSPI